MKVFLVIALSILSSCIIYAPPEKRDGPKDVGQAYIEGCKDVLHELSRVECEDKDNE